MDASVYKAQDIWMHVCNWLPQMHVMNVDKTEKEILQQVGR